MKGSKIDLVRAFMQVEGNTNLSNTGHYLDGTVQFSGISDINGERKGIRISMDKNQVEIINECHTVMEVYECYKEMEFF